MPQINIVYKRMPSGVRFYFVPEEGEKMKKRCPKCQRQYGPLSNYCSKCGIELEKDANRCSEGKTVLCNNSSFEDDDTYCTYCGALTTYALEQQNQDQ